MANGVQWCVCVVFFFFFFGGGGGYLCLIQQFFFFCLKNAASGKKCVCTFDETINVLVQCCVLDKWVL